MADGGGRLNVSHYSGIRASAVSHIRRRVRERQDGILPLVDRLAATIPKAQSVTA